MSGVHAKSLGLIAWQRRNLFRSWHRGTRETRPTAPAREFSRLNRRFDACGVCNKNTAAVRRAAFSFDFTPIDGAAAIKAMNSNPADGSMIPTARLSCGRTCRPTAHYGSNYGRALKRIGGVLPKFGAATAVLETL
jgi:hypothetical protein